tara:strand:- start:238 stop:459 length:222 start_codon:yes stop_codon:yes gene_type:complete
MYKKIILIIMIILYSCSNDESNNSADCTDFEDTEFSTLSLKDINPNSETYEQYINLETFSNVIQLFYFSNKET